MQRSLAREAFSVILITSRRCVASSTVACVSWSDEEHSTRQPVCTTYIQLYVNVTIYCNMTFYVTGRNMETMLQLVQKLCSPVFGFYVSNGMHGGFAYIARNSNSISFANIHGHNTTYYILQWFRNLMQTRFSKSFMNRFLHQMWRHWGKTMEHHTRGNRRLKTRPAGDVLHKKR